MNELLSTEAQMKLMYIQLGCLIVTIFLIIIYANQSKRHEKIERRRTTKEEINRLFDTVDPINPAKIQEFSNN